MRQSCPGCGFGELSTPWILSSHPVVLNYRFATADAAKSMRRTDLHLVECQRCRLIFNASFDADLVPYDENYDNRQGFSPAFVEHLGSVANTLSTRFSIRNGIIFEVGCGKGDFLKQVCKATGSAGIGFDTTCELEGPDPDGIVFGKRYATEADVPSDTSAILCRHVVEHVPEIGSFLALLHRMAVKGDAKVVYIETPAWEWIEENCAFWDLFHEHCNYFRQSTLAWLAQNVGFTVLQHDLVFGGQYQALYLAPAATSSESSAAPCPQESWEQLSGRFTAAIRDLQTRIRSLAPNGNWGIWGAGAKGVTLVNHLASPPPSFVVDTNPAKWGMFIPGTGVPIVPPNSPLLREADSILVANPNYLNEIRMAAAEIGITPNFFTI